MLKNPLAPSVRPSFTSAKAPASCPVCHGPAEAGRELPAAFIREALALYYRTPVPDDVRIDDYQMWACQVCTLEFAWPPRAGDASFYGWITRFPSYYPGERWEWGEVRWQLAAEHRPLRVLEVGCGAGDFICSLRTVSDLSAVGLDTTEGSVAACRAKGLEVYGETLDGFEQRILPSQSRPDVVVAFHCLEHVEDPRGLIAGMSRLLAPGGRMFVSTPYSPMSFEGMWFDPLNHPPHHMTRWNRRSYQELAAQLNLAIKFTLPPAHGVISRIAESFNLALNGPSGMQDRRTILSRAIGSPGRLMREAARQLMRPRIGARTAANVVLVELTSRA